MDFSKDTNANWSDTSSGCGEIGSGQPENAGQRQVSKMSRMIRARSGQPENAGQRQDRERLLRCADRSGQPENAGQRQEGAPGLDLRPSSGHPENADQVRRYNFKLYPNKAQAAVLQRQASLLAALWNAALEQRETQWAQECQRRPRGERKGIGKFDQGRDLKFIRADDPEYAAMSSDTMNLCLIALDDAFKAFFRRAKGGAGKSSGYPRYKSPYAIENKGVDCTIWHRDAPKGWRMERAGKHFRIHAHGISNLKDRSTWIKARGRFPVDFDDVEVRDMRLIRVGGIWQCSIVVRMAARRTAGLSKMEIDFDLLDEFARVKILADGQCLPGWSDDFSSAGERITPNVQRDVAEAPADTRETGGDDRIPYVPLHNADPADTRETGGDDRASLISLKAGKPAGTREPDAIQSSRDTRFKKFSNRWRREKKRIARLKAKEARQRREAAHLWTTRLIREASELVVICPPIKESTKSARGDERNHGAAIKPVASLNRHVLAQAPAMTIQMLEYKAAEAGTPFARITPDEHALAIGRELPVATKAARKASRQHRRLVNGNA